MKAFLAKNKYTSLLIAIYLLSELVVNPLGEFPLNDDWSYTKTARILMTQGDLSLGTFCAMTLVSHIAWGYLFIKTLGFSFFALRLSTLVSSVIGLLVLNKLVYSISKNREISFLAGLTLLFNPIYFNLSNTYMTDINFNTWMLVVFYFAYRFFETNKTIDFILVFFMSAILVLNRQFGIVMPFAFTLGCLFLREKKWRYFSYAVLGSLIVFGIFKYYESFLHRMLPAYSAYITSNNLSITDPDLPTRIWFHFTLRLTSIIEVMLVYAAPLALLFIKDVLKGLKPFAALIIAALNVCLVVYVFVDANFQFGNIFMNMTLGPDTFFDNSHDLFNNDQPNSANYWFKEILFYLRLVLTLISTTVISLSLYKGIINKKMRMSSGFNPFAVMLFCFGFAYLLLLFTPISFFDRYTIPLITVLILALSFIPVISPLRLAFAFPFILVFAYVSVAGTKDYFTLNRVRWEAVDFVKKKTGAPIHKINGGFEVNCWDDGAETWWGHYLDLTPYNYLIQYNNASGFALYKEFEFQRYFPYKKDKLNIFERVAKTP